MADRTTAYAKAVKAGKVVAGPWVRLACARHLRDLAERKKTGLVWNLERAERAIDFFPDMLPLENGDPFALLPWQHFVTGSLFGWYGADGDRRFRDAYVETGKGSGKTPMAAGLGLLALIADGEPAAEVYSAATMKEQAAIAWKDADRMVTQSAELQRAIKQEAACLTFTDRRGVESVFRPVSSEHKGLDGKRPHFAIIDELHEHPTGMVVDKMKAGTKQRMNALIFRITNSGFDRTSVCWNEHDYSVKVLQGTVKNDAWFAYVCALDEGDDFLNDPKCWAKANPGLVHGLPPMRYLRDQVTNAKGMPSKENIVKRLNGCIWTEQSERWLQMEAWDACPSEALDLDELRHLPCMMALDMASRDDFASSCKVWGPDEDGVYTAVWRFWLPEDAVAAGNKRPEAVRLQLREWADRGFIELTPGNVIDYDFIEEALLKDAAEFDVVKLPFDRWNVTQLVTHLKDALGEDKLLDFPQTMAQMSAPTKELERLVAAKKLRHGGNPVARWMASNVTVRYGTDGQVKPDRERSGDKIDGMVNLIMGLDLLMRASAEAEVSPSVYVI